jgi:hypothetical protein
MVRVCFRKSPILSALALPAGLLVAVGAVLAQNVRNPGASPDDIPVFTADTRLVVVHASVLDRNGKLIANLSESAFKVQENSVDQIIKIFRREDIPVSMGIITLIVVGGERASKNEVPDPITFPIVKR